MLEQSGGSNVFLRMQHILKVSLSPKKSDISGSPLVRVPVLSNAIAEILFAISKNSPPLYKIPSLNAIPVPTEIVVGVAKT